MLIATSFVKVLRRPLESALRANAWLRDVLQRMTDAPPASRLDELLPWNC